MPSIENLGEGDRDAERAQGLFVDVASSFVTCVLPSLVAIYASHHLKPEAPVQVGTGILISHKSRPVLVTARHVLRGHNFDEEPAEKAFHIDGRWVYVGDGPRSLFEAKDRDLAAFYADEFKFRPLLPPPAVTAANETANVITIGGFLARDFKRDGGVLQPKPWIYSNKSVRDENGMVGLLYPKRHNVESNTGDAIFNSIPRGLSGGPMLNTVNLLNANVAIVGVFTEQSDGTARGECATLVSSLLNQM